MLPSGGCCASIRKRADDRRTPAAGASGPRRVRSEFAERLRHVRDGVVISRRSLESAAALYLVYYRHHLAKEEGTILPRIEALFSEADWRDVEAEIDAIVEPTFDPQAQNASIGSDTESRAKPRVSPMPDRGEHGADSATVSPSVLSSDGANPSCRLCRNPGHRARGRRIARRSVGGPRNMSTRRPTLTSRAVAACGRLRASGGCSPKS